MTQMISKGSLYLNTDNLKIFLFLLFFFIFLGTGLGWYGVGGGVEITVIIQ